MYDQTNMNLFSSVTHLCVFEIEFVINRVVICLITYGLTHMNFVLVYPTTKNRVIVLHVKLNL